LSEFERDLTGLGREEGGELDGEFEHPGVVSVKGEGDGFGAVTLKDMLVLPGGRFGLRRSFPPLAVGGNIELGEVVSVGNFGRIRRSGNRVSGEERGGENGEDYATEKG